MIRVSYNLERALGKIEHVKIELQDKAFDKPVQIAAFKALGKLVELTPKKWTGLLRRSWKVEQKGVASYLISNTSKIMLFLENGTGNAGTATSRDGYIYPKTKRFLFIPLTASASLGGWSSNMKFGVDYVLARRVRGITARHIVRDFRPLAQRILGDEMRKFLKAVLK